MEEGREEEEEEASIYKESYVGVGLRCDVRRVSLGRIKRFS